LSRWSTWGWGVLAGLRSNANVSGEIRGSDCKRTGHRGHQEPDRAVVAVRTAQIAVDRRNRLAAAEAVVAVAVAVEVLLRKVIRLHPMLVLLLISMRDPLYLLIDDRKVLVCVMEGG